MARTRFLAMGAAILLAAAALAACSGPARPATLCGQFTQVSRLAVTRTGTIPGDHYHFSFPATVTVSSPARARAVATAACALPAALTAPHTCPRDTGPLYRLTFLTAADHKLAVITADATGCRTVAGHLDHARIADSGFWAVLGQAMGLADPGWKALAGT
ncbi:MAG: hypothetical protein ACYCPF_15515 [Streptosporangiaceae bacterium]